MKVGVDIVDIRRIEKILEKKGDVFYNKIFTDTEIRYIKNKKDNSKTVAGMFATKEAVSKLIGTGIGALNWKDIEVLYDKNGKPYINMQMKIKNYLIELGLSDIEISISHEKEYAISFAIGF